MFNSSVIYEGMIPKRDFSNSLLSPFICLLVILEFYPVMNFRHFANLAFVGTCQLFRSCSVLVCLML